MFTELASVFKYIPDEEGEGLSYKTGEVEMVKELVGLLLYQALGDPTTPMDLTGISEVTADVLSYMQQPLTAKFEPEFIHTVLLFNKHVLGK